MSLNDTILTGVGEVLNDPIPGNCYYPYITAVNQEEIKNPLLVYPSPAIDYVIFETVLNIQGAVITITDITGRPIVTLQLTGEKTVWQTAGINPGVYFYRINTSEGQSSGKFILAP
jgi:hypothetical protein